jgi:hypothetical protein
MENTDYKAKYLLYKNKYLNLKKKIEMNGGGLLEDIQDERRRRGYGPKDLPEADLSVKRQQMRLMAPQMASPTSSPLPQVNTPTSASPVPPKNTTTTNIILYDYFDPLYPFYRIPKYNEPYYRTPLYVVPKNNFLYVDVSDDEDKPKRRSKRRSRKTSKRKNSRKTSKRKNSRKTSKKRSSKKTSKRRSRK